MGFSYDNNNKILSNIFGATTAKTVTINFKSNGVEELPFIWDGTNKNDELENISVFNNNCVQISLSDRQLIVSPIGFHLFNIVTTELNELTKLLSAKTALHPTVLAWKIFLTPGTPQHIFATTLTSSSTEDMLLKLSNFETKHEEELKSYEAELSNLNKALIQSDIQNLNLSSTELGVLLSKNSNGSNQFKRNKLASFN